MRREAKITLRDCPLIPGKRGRTVFLLLLGSLLGLLFLPRLLDQWELLGISLVATLDGFPWEIQSFLASEVMHRRFYTCGSG